MKLKLFDGKQFGVGDRTVVDAEERIEKVQFTVHKFTPRSRPKNPANTIIFPHFSEFGSEIVEVLYLLPAALNGECQGKYSIVMGWHGRGYLYRHLVDEFWELKEEHQHLREYCRAFHHTSKNLKKLEKEAAKVGRLYDLNRYGIMCLQPKIELCDCGGQYEDIGNRQICNRCSRGYHPVGIYHKVKEAKENAVWVPRPSEERLEYVDKYLKPNAVGITARHRKCYGRNLPPEFYERLIYMLEDMGYNPVWIGEKETTLPCPFDRIPDFSRSEDAKDLETTLALVSKLKFTVQFWTASTRLAGLMGVPYILFESPDQIFLNGQEGYRMNLCSRSLYKLVISHYRSVLENQTFGLKLVKKAIREMENNDYNDMIGLVEDVDVVKKIRQDNLKRIGHASVY